MTKTMPETRIDQFFLMHSARADNWRAVMTAAEAWASGQGDRAAVEATLHDLAVLEEFHAYPGLRLMRSLNDRIAANDAAGTGRLVRRISDAIMTHSYAREAEADPRDKETDELPDILPSVLGKAEAHHPYFEVLFVNAQPPARWPALCAEIRRVRRPEDSFIYEPIIVGSFEDAFCAVIVNPQIAAVVVAEGVPFRSRHDAPVLRSVLDPILGQTSSDGSALQLADVIKRIRPELDLYVTTDRDVESLAGSPTAACVRRIFYGVEEPLELHLSILEGVQARYATPFFDNLKKYAPDFI